MKEVYSEKPQICEIVKAQPRTISFIMAFSKAYQVKNYSGLTFDHISN